MPNRVKDTARKEMRERPEPPDEAPRSFLRMSDLVELLNIQTRVEETSEGQEEDPAEVVRGRKEMAKEVVAVMNTEARFIRRHIREFYARVKMAEAAVKEWGKWFESD